MPYRPEGLEALPRDRQAPAAEPDTMTPGQRHRAAQVPRAVSAGNLIACDACGCAVAAPYRAAHDRACPAILLRALEAGDRR